MDLNGGRILPETSPRKLGQAEVDHRGVPHIASMVAFHAQRIVNVPGAAVRTTPGRSRQKSPSHDTRWHRPASSERRQRATPWDTAFPATSVSTSRCRGGSPCKSVERRPWPETDPSARSDSDTDRRHSAWHASASPCVGHAPSMGRKRYCRRSWRMAPPAQPPRGRQMATDAVQIVPAPSYRHHTDL
jgi:hypothetical protein